MGSIVDEHTRGLVAKTEETSQQLRTAIIASLRGLAELQPTAEKDFRTLDDSVKQQIEVIADKATILRSILDHTKATLELDEEVDLTLQIEALKKSIAEKDDLLEQGREFGRKWNATMQELHRRQTKAVFGGEEGEGDGDGRGSGFEDGSRGAFDESVRGEMELKREPGTEATVSHRQQQQQHGLTVSTGSYEQTSSFHEDVNARLQSIHAATQRSPQHFE